MALNNLRADTALRDKVAVDLDQWKEIYQQYSKPVRARDLRVLYLCGPEPLNDLEIMRSHGIALHNVWAVEGARKEFEAAIKQLSDADVSIKVHRGALGEFLDRGDDQFNIIYYDACGPFGGGRPNTIFPLLSVLAKNRLSHLSVLITNYAELPIDQFDRYVGILSSYWRYRYSDQPATTWKYNIDPAVTWADDASLRSVIQRSPEDYYSDFITRFTYELARSIIPNGRALGNKGVKQNHLVAPKTIKQLVSRAKEEGLRAKRFDEWLDIVGDTVINANAYPILSFFRALSKLKPSESLASQVGGYQIHGTSLVATTEIAGLFENVVEGHWSILSKEMLEAVGSSWFDFHNPFSCDVPLPNLLVNTLIGTYGQPYHAVTRASERLKYKAKSTEMYTDIIAFDQARYFYEWFPLVQAVPARFKSLSFQILARCLIDRLGRNDWSCESHPFRGGAVVGFGEAFSAKSYELPVRRTIK